MEISTNIDENNATGTAALMPQLTSFTGIPSVTRLASTLERPEPWLRALAAILTRLTLTLVDVYTAVQSRRA